MYRSQFTKICIDLDRQSHRKRSHKTTYTQHTSVHKSFFNIVQNVSLKHK